MAKEQHLYWHLKSQIVKIPIIYDNALSLISFLSTQV